MSSDPLEVFKSVFATGDAFVYRCRYDSEYTMEFMHGQVERICGRPIEDILNNKVVSFVGLTAPDDVDRVFGIVDAAIERGESWDMDYRLMRPDGNESWIRERGRAVYDDAGQIAYLEGLIVGAGAEVNLRADLEQAAQTTQDRSAEIHALASNIIDAVNKLSLLSVNARIEAARSGEAGVGFGVIAMEIRELAEESNRWAEQIAEKMEAVNTAQLA